jgi:hypothetical protein
MISAQVEVLALHPGIFCGSGHGKREERLLCIPIGSQGKLIPQNRCKVGIFYGPGILAHLVALQRDPPPSLYIEDPLIGGAVVEQPMGCVHVHDLDTLLVEEFGNPLKVIACGNKEGVLLLGHKDPVSIVDHIH